MLKRQKILLALLSQVRRPMSPITFVKLVFLLRHETNVSRELPFYDFVPYKYGPFSFTLYRELTSLRRDRYVTPDEECVALCENTATLSKQRAAELPTTIHQAIDRVLCRYGRQKQSALLKDVYARYPWYARRSELAELRPNVSKCSNKVRRAVNTSGYEGKSVESFLGSLIKRGIELTIDVRANPVSRRYGFSKRRFSDISNRLGLRYLHMPTLGIPSAYRVGLVNLEAYRRLLERYEREILPNVSDELDELGDVMRSTPAVLMCVEKDIRCCHRSRLAEEVSRRTGLEVKHL